MALQWIDGFEKYGSTGGAISPGDIIDWKYLGHYDERVDIYTGRDGVGKCIGLDSTATYLCTPALNVNETLILGFAFKMRDLDNGTWLCDLRHPNMQGETVGYGQFSIEISGGGNGSEIAIKNGNTTKATSNTANLQTDTWYYLEAKVYCHDSSGTCNVYLDGNEIISFSGDTRHRSGLNANDRYDRVLFRVGTSDILYIDDFYVADTSGSGVTDVVGDSVVETLSPTSDVLTDWTQDFGGNLYDRINEDTQHAGYIADDTSGNKALFETTNLSANAAAGTIQGVMLCCDSLQTQQGMNKYPKAITQNGSGGTVQDTGDFRPGTDNPLCHTVIMENDPDGNSWSASTVNQLRIGVEVS